jgi:hypothetical protein
MRTHVLETMTPQPEKTERLFMESTLLRICGALFCHDPKRASTRTQDIVINENLREKKIIVRPDPRHGQPGPLAHKVFLSILKKHSDYGRPIQNEISFGQRELIRLAGRKTIGGRDSEELVNALRQIRYTHVIALFKSGASFVEHDFNIFNEIMIERRASHVDPVISCTVRLAEPIVKSLQEEHFVCFNHSFMQPLSTISQALYMRLFFHFSNLYEVQRGKRGLQFQKRYDDICGEWLGGLTIQTKLSHIKRDQLGRHLDQLVDGKFLSSYGIEPAKSREGFVITFRPGAGFFSDYDRFYRHRNQGELQWRFQADQRQVAEPMKVAYLFIEKKTGRPMAGIPYVSSAEIQQAKNILSRVAFGNVASFLDFALGQARITNYDPQSLAGITKYLEPFLASQERRSAARAVYTAKEGKEAERKAYDAFCRAMIEKVLAALPAEDRSTIECLAQEDAARFTGNARMTDAAKMRITMARYPASVPTLEQWRGSQAA